MTSRRGRGSGRNNNATNPRVALGRLKSSLHGHANELRMLTPPQFTNKPYNTITVETKGTTASNLVIDKAYIHAALVKQLGFSDVAVPPIDLSFKLKRMDVWSLPSGSAGLCQIAATFYSIAPTISTVTAGGLIMSAVPLKALSDTGVGGVNSAKVSYEWPRDQQDVPLATLGSTTIQVLAVVKETSTGPSEWTMRFHLLWTTAEKTLSPVVGPDGQLSLPQN